MTTNNDTGSPGAGRSDRPQVMLDLKATDVSDETPPMPQETAAPGAAGDLPPPDAPSHGAAARGPSAIQAFATHLAAGVLGAVVALVLAFYLLGSFREQLPFLTERTAAGFSARLAKFEDRFAALEKTASTQRNGATQFDSLKRELASASQIDDLKRDLATLARRAEERPAAAPGASADTLQQSLDPLRSKLAEIDPLKAKAAELDALKARVAEMEARLGVVAKAQNEAETDSKASALAVAFYGLRRTAADGRPYAAELKSVATLSPVPLDLSALQGRGEQGVRNLAQLQAGFGAAANAAIDAEDRPTGSFLSQTWAKAKNLVRVRRTGEVAGSGTQEVLARIEARLKAGDLRAAASEGEQLKGDAATAFKPWLDEARARLIMDEVLARAEAALLTALGTENRVKRGS